MHEKNQALKAKQELGGAHESDHCVFVGAYEKWSNFLEQQSMDGMSFDDDAVREFCDSYFLSHSALCTIRKVRRQLLNEMHKIGLPTKSARKSPTVIRKQSTLEGYLCRLPAAKPAAVQEGVRYKSQCDDGGGRH